MRISDWSSDVCSSDLVAVVRHGMSLLVAGRINDTTRPVVPESERFQNGSLKPGGNGMPDVILDIRSEENTSELQSLMRNSYAVFCLKKKKKNYEHIYNNLLYTYTLTPSLIHSVIIS